MEYYRRGIDQNAVYIWGVDLRSEGTRVYMTERRVMQFVKDTVKVIALSGLNIGQVVGVPGRNLNLCYAMSREVAELAGVPMVSMNYQNPNAPATIALDVLAEWNVQQVWSVMNRSDMKYHIICPLIQEDIGYPIKYPQTITVGPKTVLDDTTYTNF